MSMIFIMIMIIIKYHHRLQLELGDDDYNDDNAGNAFDNHN